MGQEDKKDPFSFNKNINICDLYLHFKEWMKSCDPICRIPSKTKFIDNIKKNHNINTNMIIDNNMTTYIKNLQLIE